jgi:hypothetical protein
MDTEEVFASEPVSGDPPRTANHDMQLLKSKQRKIRTYILVYGKESLHLQGGRVSQTRRTVAARCRGP